MKRFLSFVLAIALALAFSGCGGQAGQSTVACSADSTWEFPSGPAPETEYERVFWYGFAQADAQKDKADTITEKELTDMLAQVIAARSGDSGGWEALTSGASEQEEVYRDYGAMLLLYAAERMDGTAFTDGFAPYLMRRTEENWDAFTQDIRGGYPLLEDSWEELCVSISSQRDRDEGTELNYLNASQEYAASRLSLVTGAPLLDISYDSFTLELTRPMTYEEGAVAVVRLFESFQDVADRFPEDEETTTRAEALFQEAKKKRDAILSTETAITKGTAQIPGETYTGMAYYIASSGNDSAAGTSPETAWASIDRLNRAQLRPGDAVFFKRGDLWRAVQIDSREGVTYSAYGEGEKPRLYGSVENGGGAENWTLWHEGETGEKIWVYARDMLDCGAIVMNSGEAVAEKVQAFWNGQTYQVYSSLWHTGRDGPAAADQAAQPAFDPAADLTEDMTFFAQASGGLPDTLPVYLLGWIDTGGQEPYCLTAKGPLYLRCDRGNPGELYGEIEFLSPQAPFDGVQDDVVIDNLALRYTGRDLISVAPECSGVTVQNCDLGWGGGCTASYAMDELTGYVAGAQRNGGVGGTSSSHNTFRNNYVYESYQEGLGLETAIEFSGEAFDVTDVLFEGNVFYHCASPLLYFNWDKEANPEHQFRNIAVRGNYVLYSGMSSWTDVENVNGAYLIDGGPNMQDGTAEVKDNVFFVSDDCLVFINNYVPEYLPDFEGNRYVQLGSQRLIFSETAPSYWSVNAEEGIRGLLDDQSGEILILPSPRWKSVDW